MENVKRIRVLSLVTDTATKVKRDQCSQEMINYCCLVILRVEFIDCRQTLT